MRQRLVASIVGAVLLAGWPAPAPVAAVPSPVPEAVAGGGARVGDDIGDGGPALDAWIGPGRGIAVGPRDELYVSSDGGARVRRIEAGVITTVAGTGHRGWSGDGGPATSADVAVDELAVGPDGSVYLSARTEAVVRRVAPDGTITSLAGTGVAWGSDAAGPASSAPIVPGMMSFDPAGALVVVAHSPLNGSPVQVRRVDADGRITTLAGSCCAEPTGEPFDGMPATTPVWLSAGVVRSDGVLVVAAARSLWTVESGVYRRLGEPRTQIVTYLAADPLGGLVSSDMLISPHQVLQQVRRQDASGRVVTLLSAAAPAPFALDRAGALVAKDPLDVVRRWSGVAPPAGAGATPFTPFRLFDTRDGTGGVPARRLAAGETLEVVLTGRIGVPASARAVVLNVTVTNPQDAGFVTVFPCGERPLASTVNMAAGQTVANAAVAALSPSGTVCLFASASTDLLADVTAALGTDHRVIGPVRVLETRDPSGAALPAGGAVHRLDLADLVGPAVGQPGEPAAVAVNLTATEAAGDGFLTAYPCGGRPLASNLGVLTGRTVAVAAVVPLAADGSICVYASVPTHVVVDVTGALTWSVGAVEPARLLDTRVDAGGSSLPRPVARRTLTLPVLGVAGVPVAGVAAVVVTVTVTDATAPGYVTAWGCGPLPPTSTVNHGTARDAANLAVVPVAADGTICLAPSSPAHLVVDVVGYLAGTG